MVKGNNRSASLPSKDYVFKTGTKGELIFKGDFEDYYTNDEDPWDQSATGESAEYYQQSRNRIATLIKDHDASAVLEIGCGLGYACDHFNQVHTTNYSGWDICNAAITKARKKFPIFTFDVCDITKDLIHSKKYDVVILNQLLWYILPQLDKVIENCTSLLSENGILVIANAFAREQKFGTEFINGYGGAFSYFNDLKHQTKMIHAQFNDDGFRNLDGLFILNKK